MKTVEAGEGGREKEGQERKLVKEGEERNRKAGECERVIA